MRADLLLTDPPYGVDYVGKTSKKLKIVADELKSDALTNFLKNAFCVANENVKAGGAFYIFHASSNALQFLQALEATDFRTKEELIWKKNAIVMGRQDYHWQHEPCFYGWKEGATHSWYSDRKQSTVMEFDKPARCKEHPTMKPVPLFGYLIGNSTKKGDVVLDPFMGSGTTVIACEELGRIAYGVEVDPHYCDVVIDRWEHLTGKKAKKE